MITVILQIEFLLLINKNFDSKIPKTFVCNEYDLKLINHAKEIPNQIINDFNNMQIHKAIDLIMQLLRSVNKYLEIKAPWKLLKSDNTKDREDASTTLNISAQVLKIGTVLLNPIMPTKTNLLLSAMGVNSCNNYSFGDLKTGTQISKLKNLFPRIEEDK